MNIRQYNLLDKNNVLELLYENTPTFFHPDEKKDFLLYLDNFADNFFLLEKDNLLQACGGFNLTDDQETAKISWDIVLPQLHGKGMGTLLMNYRINKIREISSIKTISVRTSQLVYKYYEKFGMILQDTVPDYWAKGFDLYTLSCNIDEIVEQTIFD